MAADTDELRHTTAAILRPSRFDEWMKDCIDTFEDERSFEQVAEGYRAILRHHVWQPWAVHIWGLFRRDDIENQSDPLSYTLTAPTPVLTRSPDGTISKEEVVYRIYSVQTPVRYQGRGYATRLLQLLHYTLAGPDRLPPPPEYWGPLAPVALAPGSERPATLPRAIGAYLMTRPALYDLYRKCTLGDEPDTGFNLPDDMNHQLNFKIPRDGCWEQAEVAGWSSAWIRRRDLPDFEALAGGQLARQLAADTSFNGKWSVAPHPGHPGALDYHGRMIQALWKKGSAPTWAADDIVGVQFHPSTTADTPPAASLDTPFCIFWPGWMPGLISVTHLSPSFPSNLVPLLLAQWKRLGVETQCESITMSGVRRRDASTAEFVRRGAELSCKVPTDQAWGGIWYGPREHGQPSWQYMEGWAI